MSTHQKSAATDLPIFLPAPSAGGGGGSDADDDGGDGGDIWIR